MTTEILPIGLLSSLAADFLGNQWHGWSSGTSPGLIAAIATLFLAIAAKELCRRFVIIALTAAIVLPDFIAALAPNPEMFVVGRLVRYCCRRIVDIRCGCRPSADA